MMFITRSGRPAVGQKLEVPGHGLCTVESNDDPSVVTLRTFNGTTFRIGERTLRLALLSAAGEDVRPTEVRK